MGLFTKTKTESIKWLVKAEEAHYELAIDDSQATLQLNMIGLEEDDLKLLSAFQPVVRENIIAVVDRFYSTILTVPELREIIEKHSTIEKIRATFSKHIIEMFNGTINQEFLEVRHMARIHINVGLKPKWYISSFQNMHNELGKIVFKNAANPEDQQALIAAISKILSFEQQLVLESYENERTKSSEAAFRLIREEVKGQIILIASELAMHSNRTNEAMKTMATKSKSFMDLVNKTTKQSHHSRDLATEGQSRLKELTEKILALSAHTNDVEQAIESLNMSLEQIGGFVGTVQDIADQTNLLSLNSAIEAARAGEHGRGFAVVADEVRKLADQTKKSISEIYSIVQTSTNYMNEVISSISKVQDVIQAGEKESAQTQMSFNNIIASMDDSLEGNHTIQQQIINVISLIDEVEQSMMTVAGQAETLNSTATSL